MIVNVVELYGLLALFLAVGVAVWRGRTTERRIAGVIAVAWIGSLILDNDSTRGMQWAIFGVDVALALYLACEALFGRKLWPVFTAAAQILIVLTHVAFMIDDRLIHEAFFSAYYVWSYVVLACLFLGSLFTTTPRAEKVRRRRAVWRRPEPPTESM